MKNTQFKVDLSVLEAVRLLKRSSFADLVDQEIREVGNNHLAILIFEKYFIRVSNRVSLVVIIDDFDGNSNIKAIASGGGRGVYSDFDWGASDSFEISVEKLFKEYLEKNEE